jgi:hypothetical protein
MGTTKLAENVFGNLNKKMRLEGPINFFILLVRQREKCSKW